MLHARFIYMFPKGCDIEQITVCAWTLVAVTDAHVTLLAPVLTKEARLRLYKCVWLREVWCVVVRFDVVWYCDSHVNPMLHPYYSHVTPKLPQCHPMLPSPLPPRDFHVTPRYSMFLPCTTPTQRSQATTLVHKSFESKMKYKTAHHSSRKKCPETIVQCTPGSLLGPIIWHEQHMR